MQERSASLGDGDRGAVVEHTAATRAVTALARFVADCEDVPAPLRQAASQIDPHDAAAVGRRAGRATRAGRANGAGRAADGAGAIGPGGVTGAGRAGDGGGAIGPGGETGPGGAPVGAGSSGGTVPWQPTLFEWPPIDEEMAKLVSDSVQISLQSGLPLPSLLGLVYQAAQMRGDWRRGGIFYTPDTLARRLVALALEGLIPLPDGRDDLGATGPLPVVLDPACGGGAFLLAAAEALRRTSGRSAADCLSAVRGCDVDRGAVRVARMALAWWVSEHDGQPVWPAADAVRCGDGLSGPADGGPGPARASVVVGNPPFLNQLQQGTARSEGSRRRLQQRFGDAANGYVDTATLFLLAGLDAVRPGGVVALVQPESMLVASHGRAARATLAERASLDALWIGGGGVFTAAVRVCAPVLRRRGGPGRSADGSDADGSDAGGSGGGGSGACGSDAGGSDAGGSGGGGSGARGSVAGGSGGGGSGAGGFTERTGAGGADAVSVALFSGSMVTPSGRFDVDSPQRRRDAAAGVWAPLLASSRGVPAISLQAGGTLADLATATAGFREQFYGLVPYVRESPDSQPDPPEAGGTPSIDGSDDRPVSAPLLTSGGIGVGHHLWGVRPTRFAGTTWRRPAVDLPALQTGDPRLSRWVRDRLRPKLLVAAQTPVLCAVADPLGRFVPSVPVISVEPFDDEALWLVAAVLWTPAVTLEAASRFAGAGLSAQALRLSARQVLSLPTPVDDRLWGDAARRLRDAVETATIRASDVDNPLVEIGERFATMMSDAYRIDRQSADQAKRWWRAAGERHLPATVL